jgi:hypothetical protein
MESNWEVWKITLNAAKDNFDFYNRRRNLTREEAEDIYTNFHPIESEFDQYLIIQNKRGEETTASEVKSLLKKELENRVKEVTSSIKVF